MVCPSECITSGGHTAVHAVLCVCVSCSVMSNSAIPCQVPLSMGFSRQEILESVAIPFSRRSSWPRDQTSVSCFAGGSFTVWVAREDTARTRSSLRLNENSASLISPKGLQVYVSTVSIAVSSKLHAEFSLSHCVLPLKITLIFSSQGWKGNEL